jgi:hypothetical protein
MEPNAIEVVRALDDFDGRHVDDLTALQKKTPLSPAVVGVVIEAMASPRESVQVGATWLLKAYLDDGASLSPREVERIGGRLVGLNDGFARLHVCQSVRRLVIPEPVATAFAAFVRECMVSPNTYLRAWGPDAFAHLARQHPAFEDEARRKVEGALSDTAASVRARARNTLKET